MAGGKSVSKSTEKARMVHSQLGQTALELRQIQSSVVVAVAALKQQNCELDEDIARVLQRSVVDRLEDQIGRLEALLRLLSSIDRT